MSSPAAHTPADAPDAPVCESRAGAGSELEQSEGEDEALTPLSLLFARGFAAHRAVEAGSAPEVRACWVPLLAAADAERGVLAERRRRLRLAWRHCVTRRRPCARSASSRATSARRTWPRGTSSTSSSPSC